MKKLGKVYLVGAGPGDPGLVTVRGLKIIRMADVIIHDRLAPIELLEEKRSDANIIYVGKSPGNQPKTQDEINRELVRLAQEGKTVCRLKGGDPFVFGRGGEEALALTKAQIEWEVIPGITSPIASAAYAGIPVTQRGVSSSLTIITGSKEHGSQDNSINWEALANIGGTIAFVMGWSRMQSIVDDLIKHGLSSSTPAALIQWGTTKKHKTVSAPLQEIVQVGLDNNISSPVILLTGEVVSIRKNLGWFDRRALFGKKILVTRARSQASELARQLEQHGATTMELPVIKAVEPQDLSTLDNVLCKIDLYHWIIFTSSNAIRSVFNRMRELNLDIRNLSKVKIATVGPGTAKTLKDIGINADLLPERFDAKGLLEKFENLNIKNQYVFFPRSNLSTKSLSAGLNKLGDKVEEVIAYENIMEEDSASIAIETYEKGVDVTTFTSSSAVKNLFNLLDQDVRSVNKTFVVCIGPNTAKTAEELNIYVNSIAKKQSIHGLVETIRHAAEAGEF